MTTQKYRVGSAYYSSYQTCLRGGLSIYDDSIYSTKTEFDSRDEAIAAAKKLASQRKDDVTIWKIDSVAKFPLPVIEIETVV